MAYQQTTGASPEDVIDKIGGFAAANGWTVVQNTLSGAKRTLVLKRSGDYIQLWNDGVEDIYITGYVGYASGAAYNAQLGYAGQYARANIGTGAYTNVFMFADAAPSEHVHVVIEMAGGVFRHITFGEIDKLGTWTGGTFFDATYWYPSTYATYYWMENHSPVFNTYGGQPWTGGLRCDIPADGRSNAWALFDILNFSYHVRTGLYGGRRGSSTYADKSYLTDQIYPRNAPPFSGQITLGTIRADVARDGDFYSPAGVFPNVRYLNMERFAPGQEITIGSDIWKVFPMCRKGEGSSDTSHPRYGQPYSDNHAYAFKKVL